MQAPIGHRQIRYNFTNFYNNASNLQNGNSERRKPDNRSKFEERLPRIMPAFFLAIITLTSIGVTINRGLMCWSKYQTKETIVRENIRPTSDGATDFSVPFIDFILCPNYDAAYNGDKMNQFGLTKTGYRVEGKFNPAKKSNSTIDLRKVFHLLTHDIQELLHNVVIFTLDAKQSEFVEDFNDGLNKNDTINIEITTKYHNNLGRCFGIRPKSHIIKLGVASIDFVARMGVYIYFGHPGQFMYNTKTKVKAELGQRVYLDFTHELSKNELKDVEGHRCNPELNLEFDKVWYERIANVNEKLFGCSVPWHTPILSNMTGKMIEICEETDFGLQSYRKFRDFYDAKLSKDMIPCAMFEIFTGLTDVDDTDNSMDEAYIRLYLKTKMKIKSTIFHYDATTLTADIGGYVGMFLGVSLMDIGVRVYSSIILMANKVCRLMLRKVHN